MSGPPSATPRMERLPPGRHGLPREQVRESQRQRLLAAAAESLAELGYGGITVTGVARRAGVSTSTFYQRFDDLWACLLAAHEAAAERLLGEIEDACAGAADRSEGARAGIASALALLASEPALASLLSAEPPTQATALVAARLHLTDQLAGLLQSVRGSQGDPNGERAARLVGGAFALVAIRIRSDGPERLKDLTPTLTEILLAP